MTLDEVRGHRGSTLLVAHWDSSRTRIFSIFPTVAFTSRHFRFPIESLETLRSVGNVPQGAGRAHTIETGACVLLHQLTGEHTQEAEERGGGALVQLAGEAVCEQRPSVAAGCALRHAHDDPD